MRIESTSAAIQPTVQNPGSGSTAPIEGDLPKSSSEDTTGFRPTSDLQRLLALLRELPEVREEIVFDTKLRLLSGELDGVDAAQDTAIELLDSE